VAKDCVNGFSLEADLSAAVEGDMLIVLYAFFDDNLGFHGNWALLDATGIDGAVQLEHLEVPEGGSSGYIAILVSGEVTGMLEGMNTEDMMGEEMSEEDMEMLGLMLMFGLASIPMASGETTVESCMLEGDFDRSNVDLEGLNLDDGSIDSLLPLLLPILMGFMGEDGMMLPME
jgi:hypothetical protein